MDYLTDTAKQTLKDIEKDSTSEEKAWLRQYLSRQILIAKLKIIEDRHLGKWRFDDEIDLSKLTEDEKDQIGLMLVKAEIKRISSYNSCYVN